MRELFAEDPQRFERFSLRFEDILFDYSKNRVTEETMALLFDLAREAELSAKIEAMFTGAEDQQHGGPGRAARGAAQPQQPAHLSSTARTSCRR